MSKAWTIIRSPIITGAAVIDTQISEVVAVCHQGAYSGKGKSILSCGQMEWYNNMVDDRSIKRGGTQTIRSKVDGYCTPINIYDGLAYLRIKRVPTDHNLETLPF